MDGSFEKEIILNGQKGAKVNFVCAYLGHNSSSCPHSDSVFKSDKYYVRKSFLYSIKAAFKFYNTNLGARLKWIIGIQSNDKIYGRWVYFFIDIVILNL